MTCTHCGRTNGPNARFCGGCGKPLVPRCPACGSETTRDAQFCEACGAPLGGKPPDATETRKIVTIVFADLIGSTSLHERLDPESVSRVMERYHAAVRGPVEAQGGTVVQLLGDGVMCAFGVPHVAEDDAIRAVRAAVAVQHAFRDFAREQREVLGTTGLRVAVNTGEVVVSDDYAAGIGDPLNVAARLQQEAQDGDVLIGESTQRLVRDLVTLERFGVLSLKGRAETVTAYRVVSLERPAGPSTTPFVGRDDEIRRILAVYDAAVAARRARLAVILGSPGLGKSRLIHEVARRIGDGATVLTAQCDATGGATFAPIAKALRAGLRIDEAASGEALRTALDAVAPGADAERARIGDGIAALLSGTPAPPEETFFVIRRQLAALAAAQPVVLAIDDLQWAEPLLLDLTEHLVQWSTDVPLLLLVAARPELREARSSLAAPGGTVAEVVTLTGLDAGAATRLAANVIGADELPAAVAGRVLATSEGNPLFVGELVRMLVHDGALKREGERWTTAIDLANVEMPPTIQALLAARIERLRPEERLVLERAAVVGRQFSRAAVTHLLPREITDLDARLEALRRSELVEPDVGWFLGEPALRFHHVLIRDAAYRRILKGTRAELHARLADWLEGRAADAVEHEETIGWHLEQAHQHLRELGPIDERGSALGERAARYLAAAGRRALARDDLPVAGNLLGRAIARLEAADPTRADLALDWCEALLAAGEVGSAANAIAELARNLTTNNLTTHNLARFRAWHTCFAGQLAVLTDPQTLHGTATAVAAAADELAVAGDGAGEAKAHLVHALALSRLGRIGACEAELDKALAAARRVDDRRRANTVLANAPLAALWGPSPVTRASGRCLDVVRVLRITQGAPAVEAVALRCQAVLEALRGRAEAARRMIASARQMVEELGLTQGLLETEAFTGLIGLIDGDAPAAEQSLRAAYDGFRAQGLGIDAARAAGLLGFALLGEGRAAEAEALSHESEALAGDDLQAAITWRRVRAEALARRGEHSFAVEFARAAVDIAEATDALLHHADARLGLAVALRAAGRSGEAAAEQARAVELWEAKGATLLAERARRTAPVAQVDGLSIPRDEPEQSVRRRVQPNAATAAVARVNAAFAARDGDALARLSGDLVDHTTHLAFDRRDVPSAWKSILKADDPSYCFEPLATLGDSLALCRRSVSASGVTGGTFDIGSYEVENFLLIGVGVQGGRTRSEMFAADRLGDAIVRLYERYAELLPDGPERTRAVATARSVVPVRERFDPDRYAAVFAPEIEGVDHRAIIGWGSVRGAGALREVLRTQLEVAVDIAIRVDDIVALRSDASLLRWTNFGKARVGGGEYERHYLILWAFGPDGFATHMELFDADRDADALARFDELVLNRARSELAQRPVEGPLPSLVEAPVPRVEGLVAQSPAARPSRRRLKPNVATVHAARLSAAIAARDAAALPTLIAAEGEVVHHPTQTVYDLGEHLRVWNAMIEARDGAIVFEPLATLGDSLALGRQSVSASRGAGKTFDIGPYEVELITLLEVDEQGRRRHSEHFAPDRLGDAVVRLYRRYAELLVDGRARARAAATARAVSTLVGPLELAHYRTAFAPTIQFLDHRSVGLGPVHGADALLRALGFLLELADDVANRVDGILGIRSDAFLARWTNFGTDRTGGGAYERPFLMLWVFGPDGLATRGEQFDTHREDEALARFDELTAAPPAVRPLHRRLRPNAATANAARIDTAMAARDSEALATLLADPSDIVDHTTGTAYDREGLLASWRSLLQGQDPTYWVEPLTTLGDSLALCRQWVSASGMATRQFDVGAYETEKVILIEADEQGRRRRSEIFAGDRLGDAVARLYERYAELLPDGPERARAAATARSIPAYTGPVNLERHAAAAAPDVEFVDRRTLGVGSARGVDEFIRVLASLVEAAPDATNRFDDVLSLRPDAWLLAMTNFGTDRTTGGTYERQFFCVCVFGSDGRATHIEQFDAGRYAEALARFDELTVEPPAPRAVPRSVRPNAATANAARMDAAAAAGQLDALAGLIAEPAETIDHTTGVMYDREGALASMSSLSSVRDLAFRTEALATLGDVLALSRESLAASGFAGAKFDVGPYERDRILLIEVDANGRRRRTESFATEHLDDALVRLYERYAELLPDGPERVRAAAIARSLAATIDALDLERYGTALAADIEFVDHRTLGFGNTQGAGALLDAIRTLFETTDRNAVRVDAVLGLHSSALLLCQTTYGTLRSSGGDYEIPRLVLRVFDGEGLLARLEFFEPGDEADALARFDAVTAESPAIAPRAPRFENAATRAVDRTTRAWEVRDLDDVAAGLAPEFRQIDRRKMARIELGRGEYLEWIRSMLRMTSARFAAEVLATRGERLALRHVLWSGASGSIGPSEVEFLQVDEVDADGRFLANVTFDPDDLDAAYAELDARYAGGEGARFAARRFDAFINNRNWEALTEHLAPNLVVQDNRRLGWEPLRGPAAYLAGLHALVELAPDARIRANHMRESQRTILLVTTLSGTREGGVFEDQRAVVGEFDGRQTVSRLDFYDLDQLDEARACYESLAAKAPPPPIENAATRVGDRLREAMEARDWERFAAFFASGFRSIDRQKMAQLEADRERYLDAWRPIFETFTSSTITSDLLATRGERLLLARIRWTGSSHSVGPSEFEWLEIFEVDDNGQIVTEVTFDPDDLDTAYAELDERYAAGEAAAYAVEFEFGQRLVRGVAARDWDAQAALCAPDFVVEDHGRLGGGTLDRATYLESVKAMIALTSDSRARTDHLWLCAHGVLGIHLVLGTHEGGTFEQPRVTVSEIDAQGRERRRDIYTLEQLEDAWAQFEALGGRRGSAGATRPSAARPEGEAGIAPTDRGEVAAASRDPLRIPPNAATRAGDRWGECIETEDWDSLRELCGPIVFDDRRRLSRTKGGCEMVVSSSRHIASLRARLSRTLLATAGDRLALHRERWTRSGDGAAAEGETLSEVETLEVTEVDAEGRIVAAIHFDPDDRQAAALEMLERHAHSDGARELPAAWFDGLRAVNEHDVDRLRALLSDDFVMVDHRRTGLGHLNAEDYLASLVVLIEQAPDVTTETLYVVAAERHGVLLVARNFGTWRDAGAFEQVYARIGLTRGDRIVRVEMFELEDLDRARARFAELGAETAA